MHTLNCHWSALYGNRFGLADGRTYVISVQHANSMGYQNSFVQPERGGWGGGAKSGTNRTVSPLNTIAGVF
jgi:hypothetical protein